jgi:hypothetical protein
MGVRKAGCSCGGRGQDVDFDAGGLIVVEHRYAVASAAGSGPTDGPSDQAAGASEPPQPPQAAGGLSAPRGSVYLSERQIAHKPSTRRA